MGEANANASLERIAKGMGFIPYMRHLGMEFVEGAEGYVKLRMRFQKEITTAADALHGGAIASLIDNAGSLAAWTTAELGNPRYFGSTVGITVNYLSGVIGEDCYGEGRVLKRGKELIYSDVRVTNETGKLCAQGTVIYRIIDRGEQT